MNTLKIQKKVIFISGSSSGIGFHLAKLFQQLGYIVLINGHNKKRLNLASSLLNNCPSYFGDITDRKVVEKISLHSKISTNELAKIINIPIHELSPILTILELVVFNLYNL